MNKGILIVSAGIMQIPAIKKARELGYFVIATDRNPEAVGFKLADISIAIDSKDINGHIEFVKKHKGEYNICGAFAGSDVAVTVAAINKFLGVEAVSIEAAERSNNKWLMKQAWMKDGVASPASIHVTTLAEAEAALQRAGLPCMVKSVDNAASRGSKMIKTADELPEAFKSACTYSRTGTALIEQYITGREYSVESIIIKGELHIVSIAERHFGFLPYHIETAHIDPVVVTSQQYDEIKSLVSKAAVSLGITTGPAKSDLIEDQEGFKILEMPARLSGGFHSQYTTPLSTGMEPIKAVLQLAVGDEVNMKYITPVHNGYSMCAGLFPGPGKIKLVEGIEEARRLPGVHEIICIKGSGDTISEYIHNGNRFFWIITAGKSRDEVIETFEKAKSLIKFNLEE
jgi:biotin carboxylase